MKLKNMTFEEKCDYIYKKYPWEFDSINDVYDIADYLNKLYSEGGITAVNDWFLPAATEEYKNDYKSLITNLKEHESNTNSIGKKFIIESAKHSDEEFQDKVLDLAIQMDKFSFDYDPYEYKDYYNSDSEAVNENIKMLFNDTARKETIDWFKKIIEEDNTEEIKEKAQDIINEINSLFGNEINESNINGNDVATRLQMIQSQIRNLLTDISHSEPDLKAVSGMLISTIEECVKQAHI